MFLEKRRSGKLEVTAAGVRFVDGLPFPNSATIFRVAAGMRA
jgi:hypothetical protein